MKISDKEARKLASQLKIDLKKIPFNEFKQGLKVEMEHGPKNGGISTKTDVTGGCPLKTAKIALAHLKERSDYYSMLKKVEHGTKNNSQKGISKRKKGKS